MSVRSTTWAWEQDLIETPTDRFILIALADHGNSDGEHIFPSMDRLAGMTGFSKRTVQAAVRRLVESGVLAETGRSHLGTREFALPGVRELRGAGASPPQMTTQGGASHDAGGATDDEKVSSTAPEPSEPSGTNNKNNSNVRAVWDHYVEVFDATRQSLDSTRTTMIRNALKVRSVEDCKRAIDGLRVSPYHNGENRQQQKYLDIRYALKGNARAGESNEARIDKMGELAPVAGHGVDEGRAIALLEDVRQAKLQGVEMERGRAAYTRLIAMGFVVHAEENRVWMERAA